MTYVNTVRQNKNILSNYGITIIVISVFLLYCLLLHYYGGVIENVDYYNVLINWAVIMSTVH